MRHPDHEVTGKAREVYNRRSGVPSEPMSLPELLMRVSEFKPDLIVPHPFDLPGMTTFRGFFEDMLRIPIVGPDCACNVVAQRKDLDEKTSPR